MAIREDVLSVLAQAAPEAVSGEAISTALGVSRAAIWKHIKALEEQGWPIGATPRVGYRFLREAEPIEALVAPRLTTHALGRAYQALPTVDSTNLTARTWAMEGAPHGAVVTAAQQTLGRGRRGRSWDSPAGEGVYLSVVLRPDIPIHCVPRLTLPGALAVYRALRALGIESQIKWPNDVLIDGHKICGILTEMSGQAERVDWVVMGLGINVLQTDFPPEIAHTAGSIRKQAGQIVPRATLLAGVLNELETLYEQALSEGGFAQMLGDYRAACVTLSSHVRVIEAQSEWNGVAESVDHEGALWVRREHGECVRVLAADVSIRAKG